MEELINNELTLKEKLSEIERMKELKEINSLKKKKVKTLVRDTVTDRETGEVLAETVTQKVISNGQEPSYIKIYLQDLMLIHDVPKKASTALWEIVKRTNYDNQIVLNAALKRDICRKLDIKVNTLNNNLTEFCKKKLLYRVDTGIYMPNPYLFAKGKWEDIANLRMIVDYNSAGDKSVKLEVDGKPVDIYNNEVATDENL